MLRLVNQAEYLTELKIDGVSVVVVYENGVSACSYRGDGLVGEDVSANIRTIKAIPLRLKSAVPRLEVRGKYICPNGSLPE